MRPAFALPALLAAASLVSAQEKPKLPDEVPPRYGMPYRAKTYPQATAKEALASVVAAAEKGDVEYLVAHLLDPAFVDARLADRGRQYEAAVDAELVRVREVQRRNPGDVAPGTRVPDDAGAYRNRLIAESRQRAFAQLVRDVKEKLADDPESLKDLRRFMRGGTFPDPAGADTTAKVGVPDVPDRAAFLKKLGDRWYVENRQAEERAPEPKKEPEPKKD